MRERGRYLGDAHTANCPKMGCLSSLLMMPMTIQYPWMSLMNFVRFYEVSTWDYLFQMTNLYISLLHVIAFFIIYIDTRNNVQQALDNNWVAMELLNCMEWLSHTSYYVKVQCMLSVILSKNHHNECLCISIYDNVFIKLLEATLIFLIMFLFHLICFMISRSFIVFFSLT